MPSGVFEPIPIAYRGLYADQHLVDAYEFGRSLSGTSRVANSICHFYFHGEIKRTQRNSPIRFFAGPSKENGLLQEIVALVVTGQFPAYSPIIIQTASLFIEQMILAMIEFLLKHRSGGEAALEVISEMARNSAEFANRVHDGHMRDKQFLQDLALRLLENDRQALREIPEPVGRSVRTMHIGPPAHQTVIDEPTAEVMRSRSDIEVTEMNTYQVTLEGVFKTNGACKVRLQDGRIISGKIADPAVEQSQNLYTSALANGTPLLVSAKGTKKDGELNKLFISDAKNVS